jgi:hypothetical protein
MRSIALSLALICGLTASGSAAVAQSQSRPVVVELFTSQGCSSCPPADAVLRDLATRGDIIALGFHVDYWDRLGWKDPLSAPGATARQHQYAADFGRNEIYTPQMVVDGVRQVVGSNRQAVLEAIADARPAVIAPISFAPDRRSVSIDAGSGAGTVTLVRFVRARSNPIPRGENAGQIASDANGVTALTPLGEWTGHSVDFTIEPPGPNEGVAIVVQAPSGQILGAAAL